MSWASCSSPSCSSLSLCSVSYVRRSSWNSGSCVSGFFDRASVATVVANAILVDALPGSAHTQPPGPQWW